MEYPKTIDDVNYEQWLKITTNSPHSARNRKELLSLVRELGDDGNEHLVWDYRDIRYTAIGAEKPFFMWRQGRYPIPIAQPQLTIGDNMQVQEVQTGQILRTEIGYTTPYTRENVEKIHGEMANDKGQRVRTQYIVRRIGGRKINIPSYEDFRDGDFIDLETNGKITINTSQETERKTTTRK